MRGGSWNNKPQNLRSANRNRNDPTKRNDNNGFRLAQSGHAGSQCAYPGIPAFKNAGSAVRGCP
ncbi:MAG: hypothetical protein DM484_26870 [Candidatus Methylumidiphilus alinenensis]|uniref:Sulfatase-modifying factor enzyme-like domain-containing protein n=1 Tax=Candidatus Methylumidiphilus alinenensis TaxID=2202197 RepID=A0A2W4QG67_9GAMM|nr:MAG: hypothetical protein DM484_26870 [Candidatus Methylumidiphilus alinenensis]